MVISAKSGWEEDGGRAYILKLFLNIILDCDDQWLCREIKFSLISIGVDSDKMLQNFGQKAGATTKAGKLN